MRTKFKFEGFKTTMGSNDLEVKPIEIEVEFDLKELVELHRHSEAIINQINRVIHESPFIQEYVKRDLQSKDLDFERKKKRLDEE